jgi:hypothetical protein
MVALVRDECDRAVTLKSDIQNVCFRMRRGEGQAKPVICALTMGRWRVANAQVKKTKPAQLFSWAGFGMMLGAGKRNRTPDLRITNALLYRLSYSGIRETRL